MEDKENHSPAELKKHDTSVSLATVRDIESQWKTTSVERTYGLNMSLNTRHNHRMSQSYETVKDAEIRTLRQIEEIKSGVKKIFLHLLNMKILMLPLLKKIIFMYIIRFQNILIRHVVINGNVLKIF